MCIWKPNIRNQALFVTNKIILKCKNCSECCFSGMVFFKCDYRKQTKTLQNFVNLDYRILGRITEFAVQTTEINESVLASLVPSGRTKKT